MINEVLTYISLTNICLDNKPKWELLNMKSENILL